MICIAWQGDAQAIIWWGQGFLPEEDRSLWADILAVTGGLAANPAAFCVNS